MKGLGQRYHVQISGGMATQMQDENSGPPVNVSQNDVELNQIGKKKCSRGLYIVLAEVRCRETRNRFIGWDARDLDHPRAIGDVQEGRQITQFVCAVPENNVIA